MPAKVNWLGKGADGRGGEAAERRRVALCPSPGTASPFPGAGATSFRRSERLHAGVRGARQQSSADGRCVGRVGDGRKGTAAKSGGGGAGGTEWEGHSWGRVRSGRGARGACPPTGPVLAPGTLYPQTLREQMPSSLFPEAVGWGEVGDSVLMGTGWGVGCLCGSRSELGCGCQVQGEPLGPGETGSLLGDAGPPSLFLGHGGRRGSCVRPELMTTEQGGPLAAAVGLRSHWR